jgi:hypothetical protein
LLRSKSVDLSHGSELQLSLCGLVAE